MSKYERLLIYPLLFLALAYGFIGNPEMKASQDTVVFNRIEAREIVLVRDLVGENKTKIQGGSITLTGEYGPLKSSVDIGVLDGIASSVSLTSINFDSDEIQGAFFTSGGFQEDLPERRKESSITLFGKGKMKPKEEIFSEEQIEKTPSLELIAEGMRQTFVSSSQTVNISDGIVQTFYREGQDDRASGFWVYNKNLTPAAQMSTVGSGGNILTRNELGVSRVLIGNIEGHGGIWVFDRYGEYPAFYGHRR